MIELIVPKYIDKYITYWWNGDKVSCSLDENPSDYMDCWKIKIPIPEKFRRQFEPKGVVVAKVEEESDRPSPAEQRPESDDQV